MRITNSSEFNIEVAIFGKRYLTENDPNKRNVNNNNLCGIDVASVEESGSLMSTNKTTDERVYDHEGNSIE